MSDIPLNRQPLSTLAEVVAIAGDLIREDTPLGIGGIYLSPWVDVSAFPELRLRSLSDVASAAIGVGMWWSYDGTTAIAPPAIVAAALANTLYDSGVIPRVYNYARIGYINGAAVQTTFRFALEGFPSAGGGGGGLPISVNVDIQGQIESKPGPDPSSVRGAKGDLLLLEEPDHALRTRARALTDEGSFTDDFGNGAAVLPRALTGTAVFTNGSTAVTGVGSLFLAEVRAGDYVELIADHNNAVPVWAQVASIESDLGFTLVAAYTGAGGAAGASQVQNWYSSFSGAAAGITVANSQITITPGTAAAGYAFIYRRIGVAGRKGYPPLRYVWSGGISQRIANQEIMLGFMGVNPVTQALIPGISAVFLFDGAVNTIATIRARSSANAWDVSEQDISLPYGVTTVDTNLYEILLYPDHADFLINRVLVGVSRMIGLPYNYQEMVAVAYTANSAVVVGTNVVGNWQGYANLDDLRTETFQTDPAKLRVTPVTPTAPAASASVTVDSDLEHIIAATTQVGYRYRVSIVGGEGLCIRCDGAAPVVTNEPWYTFQKFEFISTVGANTVRAIKRVAGTADGAVVVTSLDGGFVT